MRAILVPYLVLLSPSLQHALAYMCATGQCANLCYSRHSLLYRVQHTLCESARPAMGQVNYSALVRFWVNLHIHTGHDKAHVGIARTVKGEEA